MTTQCKCYYTFQWEQPFDSPSTIVAIGRQKGQAVSVTLNRCSLHQVAPDMLALLEEFMEDEPALSQLNHRTCPTCYIPLWYESRGLQPVPHQKRCALANTVAAAKGEK